MPTRVEFVDAALRLNDDSAPPRNKYGPTKGYAGRTGSRHHPCFLSFLALRLSRHSLRARRPPHFPTSTGAVLQLPLLLATLSLLVYPKPSMQLA